MDSVTALIGNALLELGDFNAGLVTVVAPLCFSGELPLKACKTLFALVGILVVRVLLTVTCDSQILDADIHADNGTGFRQLRNGYISTAESCIVFAAWRTRHRSTENTARHDLGDSTTHLAEFRKLNVFIV